jgi:hypothetical protein
MLADGLNVGLKAENKSRTVLPVVANLTAAEHAVHDCRDRLRRKKSRTGELHRIAFPAVACIETDIGSGPIVGATTGAGGAFTAMSAAAAALIAANAKSAVDAASSFII